MRKASLPLVLIALLVFAPIADAKNRDKSWEFGLLVGQIDGDRGAEVDNGFTGELRFGYNFTAKVAAELWLSDEKTDQGNTPDFAPLGLQTVAHDPCPAMFTTTTPTCFTGAFSVKPDIDKSVEFRRAVVVVTGNFLTDRETRTVPYISAGLGVIQETREGYPFETTYAVSEDDPADPNTLRIMSTRTAPGEVLESFDSSAILLLSVGARTFFNDNWGLRYEVGYLHHDSFETNQDEYAVRVGATWVVGGQK